MGWVGTNRGELFPVGSYLALRDRWGREGRVLLRRVYTEWKGRMSGANRLPRNKDRERREDSGV